MHGTPTPALTNRRRIGEARGRAHLPAHRKALRSKDLQ